MREKVRERERIVETTSLGGVIDTDKLSPRKKERVFEKVREKENWKEENAGARKRKEKEKKKRSHNERSLISNGCKFNLHSFFFLLSFISKKTKALSLFPPLFSSLKLSENSFKKGNKNFETKNGFSIRERRKKNKRRIKSEKSREEMNLTEALFVR